jgi:hypothetical protein
MEEKKNIINWVKTGDLILCDDLEYKNWGLLSWLIKFATKSDFSHVGMVVKDPDFTKVAMKGTYIWMSGTTNIPDSEDNHMKFGVQMVPFEEYVETYGGKLYLRRIHCTKYEEIFSNEKLKKIHDVVYDKPYDITITDWIEAYCKKDPHPQKTSRFVCSAFIGYIYTQLELLARDTDWSILWPSFFSSENPDLHLLEDAYLEKEKIIK